MNSELPGALEERRHEMNGRLSWGCRAALTIHDPRGKLESIVFTMYPVCVCDFAQSMYLYCTGLHPSDYFAFDCISERQPQHQEHLSVSEIVAGVEIGVSLASVRVRTTLSMEVRRLKSGCAKRSI
jgi:hypothetical protein